MKQPANVGNVAKELTRIKSHLIAISDTKGLIKCCITIHLIIRHFSILMGV